MLTKADKSHLKALVQSPQFAALELLANEIRDTLKDASVVRDTEWETLCYTLINEGQCRGIKAFFDEIYKAIESNE